MGDYVIRASEMRFFAYIYIKLYWGSRCERVVERKGGWSGWVSEGDVTYVMTSSGRLKCVYLMYRYTKVYWETRFERCEVRDEWLGGCVRG